jgi:hypothetical protein
MPVWPKTAEIPSVFRLTVEQEKQKELLQFAFIMPSLEPIVTYQERKIL